MSFQLESHKNKDFSSFEKSLWAAEAAKILCSAIFVSHRTLEEAIPNSILCSTGLSGQEMDVFTKIEIDKESKEIRVSLKDGPLRTARFYDDQGCIILPHDARDVFFQPVKVKTSLSDPSKQEWPMGDLQPEKPLPRGVDGDELKKAVETAFLDGSKTAAFLVAYKGQIIAERYGQGVNRETQLESWSMGKSITATLIGLLINEGRFGLWDPAPIPEWRFKDDPRSEIRVADLLRMSSGLKFSGVRDSPETFDHGISDHKYIYCGAVDVFQFSVNKPLEHLPNTVGRYRNCDPLSLGYIIKRIVTAMGENYLKWPQKALFDRIGIRKQVLETDPYGNFIMTGYDYGTARNWGRLGQLYLQDGVWMEERILPEGYVDFVSTPAPAWEEPVYGGLFWVNGAGRWNLPRDSFFMSGAGGQWTIIVPSHDLVIVRMGHRLGAVAGEEALNQALETLVETIPAKA
jgi:CubicO group peptidase (beta-lactamase class C family)